MGNACTREKNDAEDEARRERRERILRATPRGSDSGDYQPGPLRSDVPWKSHPGSRRGTPENYMRQPTPTRLQQGLPPLGRGPSRPVSPMITDVRRSPVRGPGARRVSPHRGRPPTPTSTGGGVRPSTRPQTPRGQVVPVGGNSPTTGPHFPGGSGMPLMYTSSGSVARRPPSSARSATPRGRGSSGGPPTRGRGVLGRRPPSIMELKPVMIQAIGLLSADELQQRQDVLIRERDVWADINDSYQWLLRDSILFVASRDLVAVEQRNRFAVQRQEDASYYAMMKWFAELMQEARLAQLIANTLRRQHIPSPPRLRGSGGDGRSRFSSLTSSPIRQVTDAPSADTRRRNSNPPLPYYPHDPLPIEYSSSRRPPPVHSGASRERSTSARSALPTAAPYGASPSRPSHHDPSADEMFSPLPVSQVRNPSPLVFRASQPGPSQASQPRPKSPSRSVRPVAPISTNPAHYRDVVPTRHTERQLSLLEGQEVQERNHVEYLEQSRFASISAYLQCDEEAALMEKIARQQRMVESSKSAYRPAPSQGRWGSIPPPSRRAPPTPMYSSHAGTPHQLSVHSRATNSDAKSASMLATQYRLTSLSNLNRAT